jgi:hypothetical protein
MKQAILHTPNDCAIILTVLQEPIGRHEEPIHSSHALLLITLLVESTDAWLATVAFESFDDTASCPCLQITLDGQMPDTKHRNEHSAPMTE